MAAPSSSDKEAAQAVVDSDEQSATLKLAQATLSGDANGGGGASATTDGTAAAAGLDGSQASGGGEGGMSKRQLKKAAKGLLKDKKEKKAPWCVSRLLLALSGLARWSSGCVVIIDRGSIPRPCGFTSYLTISPLCAHMLTLILSNPPKEKEKKKLAKEKEEVIVSRSISMD